MTVVVTGAAGRTGSLAVKKLAAGDFTPRAVIRSESSKGKVTALGVADKDVFYADVSAANAADYAKAFEGADAVILATSGVPKLKPLSMIPVLWAKITGKEGVRPEFEWKEGQMPQQVDWLGAKAQIDAAKAAGVKRFVVVGSMGGTQPENFLNTLGNGKILMWKRKAEQYLIASGLNYTIIHPGGLLDKPGGERTLVVGVDDELLKRKVRSIPREDVAELAVQCLRLPEASKRSFDVISLAPEEGPATKDWSALVASLDGANCDYTIESQENL